MPLVSWASTPVAPEGLEACGFAGRPSSSWLSAVPAAPEIQCRYNRSPQVEVGLGSSAGTRLSRYQRSVAQSDRAVSGSTCRRAWLMNFAAAPGALLAPSVEYRTLAADRHAAREAIPPSSQSVSRCIGHKSQRRPLLPP